MNTRDKSGDYEQPEDQGESTGPLSGKVEEGQKKNLWNRFCALLGLNRPLDTTEELEQEIQDLLEEGEDQGLIGSLEEKLITRIFDFRDTVTYEIMTPSAEMVAAEEKTSIPDLIRIITEEGYTRIPIYRETQDNIIGILHAKDLLRICKLPTDEPMNLDLHGFLNEPFFISESKPIVDLLRDFQTKKVHMAIVVDEFGGVRGLITLEDVIEEIVGEIDDEHDQDDSDLRVIDEKTIIVDAKIDIEDVGAHFDFELPEGPYESIGGLMIHRLGYVPGIGTIVQENNLEFKVLLSNKRRIKSVRVKRIP